MSSMRVSTNMAATRSHCASCINCGPDSTCYMCERCPSFDHSSGISGACGCSTSSSAMYAPESARRPSNVATANTHAHPSGPASSPNNHGVVVLETSSGSSINVRTIEDLISANGLYCLSCNDGKRFSKRSNTKRHVQSCLYEDMHLCSICSKFIKRIDNYRNHLQRQHHYRRCIYHGCDSFFYTPPGVFEGRCSEGHGGYVCDKCGKSFRDRDALERHKDSKHKS